MNDMMNEEMKDSKVSQGMLPKRLLGVSALNYNSVVGHSVNELPLLVLSEEEKSFEANNDMKECDNDMKVCDRDVKECPLSPVSSNPIIATFGDLQIRSISFEEDIEGINSVGEVCYPPGLEDDDAFQAKLIVGDSFVAVDSNTKAIVAYCIGVPWHTEPFHINEAPTKQQLMGADVYVVHDIAVHPAFRRGGLSSVLLNILLDCARERHLNKAVLVAISSLARSIWGKKGFSPMSTPADSYGADATKMEMML